MTNLVLSLTSLGYILLFTPAAMAEAAVDGVEETPYASAARNYAEQIQVGVRTADKEEPKESHKTMVADGIESHHEFYALVVNSLAYIRSIERVRVGMMDTGP